MRGAIYVMFYLRGEKTQLHDLRRQVQYTWSKALRKCFKFDNDTLLIS